MALTKERSGQRATSIQGRGKTTRNMVSASRCTKTDRSMKEAGKTINDTDKEHCGSLMRPKTSADDTLVTGSTTKRKVEAQCSSGTRTDTMDSGRTISPREKAV